MKFLETLFNCKVCDSAFKLRFKKPNLITSTRIQKVCENCDTEYHISINFKPGSGGKELDVESKYDRKRQA